MRATVRVKRGPSQRPFDTNESRRAHRKDVRHGLVTALDRQGRKRLYDGRYYVCPRCGWQSRPMKHADGAQRLGEAHALACPDAVSESVVWRPATEAPSAVSSRAAVTAG